MNRRKRLKTDPRKCHGVGVFIDRSYLLSVARRSWHFRSRDRYTGAIPARPRSIEGSCLDCPSCGARVESGPEFVELGDGGCRNLALGVQYK